MAVTISNENNKGACLNSSIIGIKGNLNICVNNSKEKDQNFIQCNIPLYRRTLFGRDKEIEEILKLINENVHVAITGMALTGKTALATECALRWLEQKRASQQVIALIDATSKKTFKKTAQELGIRLNIQVKRLGVTNMVDAITSQCDSNNIGLSIIYDNVKDHTDIEENVFHYMNYVKLFTTTQNRNIPRGFHAFLLDSLSNEGCKKLLEYELPEYFNNIEEDNIKKLTETLDGLPIVLTLCAAFVRGELKFETEINKAITVYIDKFEEYLKAKKPAEVQADYEKLYTALRMNIVKLEQNSLHVLCTMSYMDTKNIHTNIVQKILQYLSEYSLYQEEQFVMVEDTPERRTLNVTNNLKQYSLIDIEEENKIHPRKLISIVCRKLYEKDAAKYVAVLMLSLAGDRHCFEHYRNFIKSCSIEVLNEATQLFMENEQNNIIIETRNLERSQLKDWSLIEYLNFSRESYSKESSLFNFSADENKHKKNVTALLKLLEQKNKKVHNKSSQNKKEQNDSSQNKKEQKESFQNKKANVPDFIKYKIPLPKKKLFGRDEEINEILKKIKENVSVVITGMSLIGKTALAIECAWQWVEQENDSQKVIALLDATSEETLINSAGKLSKMLNIDVNYLEKENIIDIITGHCESNNIRLSLIYDHVQKYTDIEQYILSDKKNVKFFITLQNREIVLTKIIVHLESLSYEGCRELLENLLPEDIKIEEDNLKKITNTLDRHPVVLILYAVFLNRELESKTDVNEAITICITKFEEYLQAEKPTEAKENYEKLCTALRLNIKKLEQNSIHVLCALSYMDTTHIYTSIVQKFLPYLSEHGLYQEEINFPATYTPETKKLIVTGNLKKFSIIEEKNNKIYLMKLVTIVCRKMYEENAAMYVAVLMLSLADEENRFKHYENIIETCGTKKLTKAIQFVQVHQNNVIVEKVCEELKKCIVDKPDLKDSSLVKLLTLNK